MKGIFQKTHTDSNFSEKFPALMPSENYSLVAMIETLNCLRGSEINGFKKKVYLSRSWKLSTEISNKTCNVNQRSLSN